MKKAFVLLAALLAAAGLLAQEKAQNSDAQEKDQKAAQHAADQARQNLNTVAAVTQALQIRTEPTVRVYQVNPDNLERVRGTLRNIVGGDENISVDPATNVVVVKTTRNLAPALDELVKRLDVAAPRQKNIELTFYVVQASKEPFADAGPVPPELQSAMAQIKSIFTYQSFRLVDTLFARSRSSERISTSGQAALGKDHATLILDAEPSIISSVTPPRIRIHGLSFMVRGVSGTTSLTTTGLSADLDFNVGQKVVIGKTGVQDGQSALILIATGRIVD
jgi:hypothetical protein